MYYKISLNLPKANIVQLIFNNRSNWELIEDLVSSIFGLISENAAPGRFSWVATIKKKLRTENI